MAWAPDYATTAELKAFVYIGDSVDDAQLALAITAASRAIDNACGRQFGLISSAEARYYTAQYDRRLCRWYIEVDDFMTVTGFEVNADLEDDGVYDDEIDEYQKYPINAAATGVPWTRLNVSQHSSFQPNAREGAVEVTARWGWTTTPTPIKQACLLQASRFVARRNAPFGVAGSPDVGSELRLLANVDPDVRVILSPYVRWWAAA